MECWRESTLVQSAGDGKGIGEWMLERRWDSGSWDGRGNFFSALSSFICCKSTADNVWITTLGRATGVLPCLESGIACTWLWISTDAAYWRVRLDWTEYLMCTAVWKGTDRDTLKINTTVKRVLAPSLRAQHPQHAGWQWQLAWLCPQPK